MINLKLALRTLFKSAFVTMVAIVSLALRIGSRIDPVRALRYA